MDFSLNEEQAAIAELAGQILADGSDPAALRALEVSDAPRFDRALWKTLADSGVLAAFLPEQHGGSGLDLVALGATLDHLGRTKAAVPLWETLALGALPIAQFAEASIAADWLVLVPTGAEGVSITAVETSAASPDALIEFSSAPGTVIATGVDAATWAFERAVATQCGLMVGVCESALRLTAEYTKERKQFDMPIASEVAIAKAWAADGAHKVVLAAQHLHGGVGVDRDYPVHRSYVLSKQIELFLGGATESYRRLGELIASGTE